MATRRQQRQALIQRRVIDAVIVKYERAIAREIQRATIDTLRRLQRDELLAADVARNEHSKRLERILNALWVESGEAIGGVMESMKSAARFERKEFFTAPNATMAAANYARIFSSTKITQISDTTISDVQAVIAEGIAAGRTEQEIARLVRSVAPIKSASRAQTIARTESGGASSFVAQSMAELSGVELVRVWVAVTSSDRTRTDHHEADGQERGMNEPFDVGGEQLMYPSDPNGSAHNVITCCCQVVYEPR